MNNPTHNILSAIRYTLSAILMVLFCLMLLQTAQAATTNQISQFGITWTFDKQYEYGQFANGDYWVVGPVKIVGIDPSPVCSTTDGRNGTMINPRFKFIQGYDARGVGYNTSVCYTPPFTVVPGDTLVSSISLDVLTSKSYIRTMTVLTIVDKLQSQDKFRSPACRPERTADSSNDPLIFSANNIHWDFLEQLNPNISIPNISISEQKFERFRMEHFPGYENMLFNQIENTSTYNYGREIASDVSVATLHLLLNYSIEQKRKLMIRLLQYGIDLYGVYLDGGGWASDGGIFCGRKWTLLFTGIMLDNQIKNIPMLPERFHEDGQTFYVADTEIYTQPYTLNMYSDWQTGSSGYAKVTNSSKNVEGVNTEWLKIGVGGINATYWFGIKDDIEAYKADGRAYKVESVIDNTHLTLTEPYRGQTNISGTAFYKSGNWFVWYGHGKKDKEADYIEYEEKHRGLPEWGIEHDDEPIEDGLDWDASYRRCCNANAFAGFVLAAHIMEPKTGARTLWNHPAFFDFQDRYMEVEASLGTTGTWERQWTRFAENMWDTYRANYGCVWTRDNPSDIYSNGHRINCNQVLYGDVSGDGEISAYDAALTARIAVGLDPLGDKLQVADVSGDGEVSAYDAALIAQRAVGLINRFPVES